MPRTLADMTPQEREACVGMWCYFRTPNGVLGSGIIVEVDSACADVFTPQNLNFYAEDRWVTPRFDLPRAWGADGEPVKGRKHEC